MLSYCIPRYPSGQAGTYLAEQTPSYEPEGVSMDETTKKITESLSQGVCAKQYDTGSQTRDLKVSGLGHFEYITSTANQSPLQGACFPNLPAE